MLSYFFNFYRSVAIPPQETNEVTDTAGIDGTSDPSSLNRLKLLNKSQRKTVKTNPGSLQAVAAAVTLAVTECRYQFRLRRWDCPTSTKTTGQTSLFGKILLKGELTSIIRNIISEIHVYPFK